VGKRAFTLQIREGERLKVMAEEQYLREIELPPRRGRIFDRNGAELASTADVDSGLLQPAPLRRRARRGRRLARVLGLETRELEKRLAQRRYFAWIKRKVTPDEVAAVRALDLPGVAFTREPRRFYPNRTLAATVMGQSGVDGRGLDGVELAFDSYLRAARRRCRGCATRSGASLFVARRPTPPTAPAANVVLTLDRYLTFVHRARDRRRGARHHAKSVVGVMLDPRTGEILAMASVPSFNPTIRAAPPRGRPATAPSPTPSSPGRP